MQLPVAYLVPDREPLPPRLGDVRTHPDEALLPVPNEARVGAIEPALDHDDAEREGEVFQNQVGRLGEPEPRPQFHGPRDRGTGLGTFQKYFGQSELREYLERELDADAFPAEPGIFYVFRDEVAGQQFLASRYRRRAAGPRKRLSEVRFEQHRELLEPLLAAITELGRLPNPEEYANTAAVVAEFGSLKRAFSLIRRVTGEDEWEALRTERIEDMLVYLALARFRKRPPFGHLPHTLQADVRAFFGAYTKACTRADELLFQTGKADAIDEACERSAVGKLLLDDLYVHRDALGSLEPLLRIYEGCGRAYLGDIEGANIIKIHRRTGKLSYLVYPDFEEDPHPALVRCVKLNLRTRQVEYYDYGESANPPVLHRKETFLPTDHPLREKFAKLTAQEEKAGLLTETSSIGTRDGWERRLVGKGYALKGHRLVIRNPDPSSEVQEGLATNS